ncbi:hypothetical protein NEOLEDRAFT_1134185 [Neolentinus lepideus HHB14362 ss-1]|uniref:Uncharacterized protein n=1 Tax=Neolentinus lepideus HHB14362 ss-1 TaxID=1314782 RepID=A0A165SCW2_9AGAM|nr:hypothetical protein NEOLEDRAFT_1134185 [Neolentinus lepideus HHB14362 ss-1]
MAGGNHDSTTATVGLPPRRMSAFSLALILSSSNCEREVCARWMVDDLLGMHSTVVGRHVRDSRRRAMLYRRRHPVKYRLHERC